MYRRHSISTWLGLALLGVVAPFCLFLWFLAAQLQQNATEAVDRQTLRSAQSISQTVEPLIESMKTTLSLLSSTEDLDAGDLEAFHRRSQYALQGTGQFVILTDEAGRQLINTRVVYGAELGNISDMDGFVRALEAGRAIVSDFFMGKTSGKWVFNVLDPLSGAPGSRASMLVTTMNVDDLASSVSQVPLSAGWSAVVVDRRGNVFFADSPETMQRGDRGLLPGQLRNLDLGDGPRVVHFEDGEEQVFAYSPVRGTTWNIAVWGPLSSAQKPIVETWRMLLAGTLTLLAVCVAVIYAASRLLKREVRGMTRMALDLGRGEIVPPVETRIREIDLVARALSTASYDRGTKDEQLGFVMGELAHRTKNLIAVVLAILRQSAKHADTPQQLVRTATERIQGLGRSIDLLTAGDSNSVTMRDLIENHLSTFAQIGAGVVLSGPEVKLGPDVVQHLGMAFHELATNASKHGALSVASGRVEIDWTLDDSEDPARLKLTWREKGGPPVSVPEKTSFGTRILLGHTSSSLGGITDLDYRTEGLVWTLDVPASALHQRYSEDGGLQDS
ncbi:MAG: sensor histidine kinase [Roseitalea porphyridii]|uniref:sensor histidine kinase n=1 Tax=Roseitalea porphyridii TaxID=1852022 RepID=UPI0032ECF926